MKGARLAVEAYAPAARDGWQAFVESAPGASLYHDIRWREVVEETFGHPTRYRLCRDPDGRIVGVLPLVHLKSLLFGSFLVSMPYFNYGGICAETEAARDALLSSAVEAARETGARHVELRHTAPLAFDWPLRTDKVSMRLTLPDDPEVLWARLGSKLRSQVKRPQKVGMEALIEGPERLDAFYEVFAANMRDLGTPVYPKRFFAAILERFPESTRICSVYAGSRPVASGFLVGFRRTLEIPWASSLRSHNHASPNMLLYWRALAFACEQGYETFDFGRSSRDAGTYRFKAQWGAEPTTLHWHYWLRTPGVLPQLTPSNPKYRMAIGIWRRLPVAVTRVLGPRIVRSLP